MHEPRFFAGDDAIRRLGEGLIACSLTRPEWTHEAHLASCLYLVAERSDIDVEAELPALIRRFNESVGGVNDDMQGYHETITQCFIAAVRAHLAETDPGLSLADKVNRLLASPRGRRDWPLRFYSPERLFSVEARRGFVAPDQASAPAI